MTDIDALRRFIASFDNIAGTNQAEENLLNDVLAKRTAANGRVDYDAALEDLEAIRRARARSNQAASSKDMSAMSKAIGTPPAENAAPKTIPIRVYWDDPLQPPVVVEMPSTAVHWRNGRPVGLHGPRVSISLDNSLQLFMSQSASAVEQSVPHKIKPVQPGDEGAFLASVDGRELGQTTSFYAAHQVLQLAERSAGRRVDWGVNGQLTVRPYAMVGTVATNANAFFNHGFRDVSLGAIAKIVDGDLQPYSGRGLDFLDDAVQAALGNVEKVRALAAKASPGERHKYDATVDRLEAQAERLKKYRDLALQEGATGESLMKGVMGTVGKPPTRSGGDAGSRRAELQILLQELSDVSRLAKVLDTTNPVENELVELAKSREVVAHEAGHAALAALKPGLSTVPGVALHEAYGDLDAFMTALERPETLDAIIDDTGGDLTKSNPATRLGEQFIRSRVRATRDTADDERVAIRDLANQITLADFPGVSRELESGSDIDRAVVEPHHLSQLLGGTIYEFFGRLANAKLAALGQEATQQKRRAAVLAARDETAMLLHRMLLFLPENGGSLRDLAGAFLEADKRYTGSKHRDLLAEVFTDRGLVARQEELPRAAGMDHLPPLTLSPRTRGKSLEAKLRSSEYAHVLERLRPKGDGQLKMVEDVTDDRGYRLIRFAWLEAPQPAPQGVDPAIWRKRQDQEMSETLRRYGEYAREAIQRKGALVFDPEGRLVAIHNVGSGLGGHGG